MLDHLISVNSDKNRLDLVKADLISKLIATINPQSFSIPDCEDMHTCLIHIITSSLRFPPQDYSATLEIEDGNEQQAVHETVFQQVLLQSEQYLSHLCVNRSVMDKSSRSANCSQTHPCHSLDVAIARSQKEKTSIFTFRVVICAILVDEFAPSVTHFGANSNDDVHLSMKGQYTHNSTILGSGTILLEGTSTRSLTLSFDSTVFATSHNPGGTTKDYYICVKQYATFDGSVIILPLDKSAFRPLAHVAKLDETEWDGSGPFVFQIDGGTITEETLSKMRCSDPSAAILNILSAEGLGTSLTFPAAQRASYSEIIRQVKVANIADFTLTVENTITQGIAIKNSGCKIVFQNHSAGEPVSDETTTDLFLDGEAKKLDDEKNKVDLPVYIDQAFVGKGGHFFNLTTKSDIVFVTISVDRKDNYFSPAVWNDYVVEVMRTKYTKSFTDKAQSEWVEMKKVAGHEGAKPYEQGYYTPKQTLFSPSSFMAYVLDTSEIKTKGEFYSVRVRTTTGTHAYLDRVLQLTDHDLKFLEREL
ncbi:hypothetical protein BLNAU_16100 [Blattamonas nauphoetae]|uniref:Uncharacterized protein n=1 Tax=Blattamonas nauphoetae TaxID=2049346 RepID=A0ABQ9XBC1_9EUKA|nr:hypothetical protein BLNAU_16100 [Blattamonas nauphoetae]